MFVFVLFLVATVCAALPNNRERSDATPTAEIKPTEAIPVAPFFTFNRDPVTISNIGSGAVTAPPKRTEKLPFQKSYRSSDNERPIPDVVPEGGEFLDFQPGVAPKLSGSVATPSPIDFEFFDFGENSGGQHAATNPAATFLEGGDFDKISAPKCRIAGCTGPVPNDGTFMVEAPVKKGKACHQTFVPLNGCTDNKGYPMGMLCSICCDCTASFMREMRKTQGFKIGFGTV